MNSRYVQLILLIGVLIGACAGDRRDLAAAAKQGVIRFSVGRGDGGKPLPGVDVFLVSSEKVLLGQTDASGAINVKTSLIRESHARAVLFCTEYFFCGAVKVTPELFEYTETYIELAPFAVR